MKEEIIKAIKAIAQTITKAHAAGAPDTLGVLNSARAIETLAQVLHIVEVAGRTGK